MRTTTAVLGLVSTIALAAVAGCAGAPAANEPGSGGGTGEPPTPVAVDDDTVLATQTTILQSSDDADPELCLGGVAESYPPQCGGPVLVGLDWADVADAETASGVTWGTGWVVGTFDREAQVFTLTEPVSTDPPDGVEVPDPDQQSFPALCEDPYRGGEEDFDAGSPQGMQAQEALTTAAAALDGYIGLYVSNGSDEFNVLVQGDAEAAHEQLREVWPGWLCVATADGASEADLSAAQGAVTDLADSGVLGSGGIDGVLQVSVILADTATVDAVLAAVEPWLTPEQVRIDGMLVPVG